MSLRTLASINRSGALQSLVAADAAGETWVPTGDEFILVNNASGASITVSLDIVPTVDGQVVTDRTVVVAPATTRIIGPFPLALYRDTTTGLARITYSAVTSVTVGFYRLLPS